VHQHVWLAKTGGGTQRPSRVPASRAALVSQAPLWEQMLQALVLFAGLAPGLVSKGCRRVPLVQRVSGLQALARALVSLARQVVGMQLPAHPLPKPVRLANPAVGAVHRTAFVRLARLEGGARQSPLRLLALARLAALAHGAKLSALGIRQSASPVVLAAGVTHWPRSFAWNAMRESGALGLA